MAFRGELEAVRSQIATVKAERSELADRLEQLSQPDRPSTQPTPRLRRLEATIAKLEPIEQQIREENERNRGLRTQVRALSDDEKAQFRARAEPGPLRSQDSRSGREDEGPGDGGSARRPTPPGAVDFREELEALENELAQSETDRDRLATQIDAFLQRSEELKKRSEKQKGTAYLDRLEARVSELVDLPARLEGTKAIGRGLEERVRQLELQRTMPRPLPASDGIVLFLGGLLLLIVLYAAVIVVLALP